MLKVQPSLCKFLFDSRVFEMSPISEFVLVTTAIGSEGLWLESLGSNGQTSSQDFDCMLVSALNVDPKPYPGPDLFVLDPTLVSPSHELAKKRKKGYKLNRHFQESWTAKLLWTEVVVGVDGRIM
jgi:hypothetical protein